MSTTQNIHFLPEQLTFRASFLFPINSPEARKDIIIGGFAVMLLLPLGWILNLGARLDVVQRLYSGNTPYFRGMKPWKRTFMRGCISATAIFCYLAPANFCFSLSFLLAYRFSFYEGAMTSALLGLFFFLIGVFTLPGCMTVYACENDPHVLKDPIKALKRVCIYRRLYCKAWLIALTSIIISFFGLFVFV
jgi:hypothetical protein